MILFFGVAVRIVTPPYQVLDEINHCARAWQLSKGKFLADFDKVRNVEQNENPTTKNLLKNVCKNGRANLHSEDEKLFAATVPHSIMPADFAIDNVNRFYAINFGMTKNFLNTPLNPTETEVHIIPNTGAYPIISYLPQAFAAFITLSGIFAIEYLIWTPVGNKIIYGVQGRYFIPILLMTSGMFSFLPTPKYANIFALLFGIFSATFTLQLTYSSFYL